MDYYKILELNKTATYDDIKKSYKKLSFKYHPDKNKSKDANDKYIKILKAYEVLSNSEKKKEYDNSLNFKNNYKEKFSKNDFEDLFSSFSSFSQNIQTNQKSYNYQTKSSSKTNFNMPNNTDFDEIFNNDFFKKNTKNFYENKNNYEDNEINEDNIKTTKYYYKCSIKDIFLKNEFKFEFNRKVKNNTIKEIIKFKIPKSFNYNESIKIKNMGNDNQNLEIFLDILSFNNFTIENNNLIYYCDITIDKAIKGFSKTITMLNNEKIKIKINSFYNSNYIYKVPKKGINNQDLFIKFNIDFLSLKD